MKRFQFLLLDAGPIIKLFELGIWDDFISSCDVTIAQTVAGEAKYASREMSDIRIDLQPYEDKGLITIIDVPASEMREFHKRFTLLYQADIHDGEKEALAFLHNAREEWLLCSADAAVFRVLGTLGRGEQGISLEEILQQIGRTNNTLAWEYTRRFREKYTSMGQTDSIQGKGLSEN